MDLDTTYGAYLRAKMPVSNIISPYVIVGWTRLKMSASVSGFGSQSASESGMSLGLGINFKLSGSAFATIEYLNYLAKEDLEVNGLTVGINAHY